MSGPDRVQDSRRTGRRLVVVDNDTSALDLAVLDLGLEGHDVVAVAHDGVTALALVHEHRPDVLVVDHRMPPGPWGIEVAEEVRRSVPETQVVVYSNYESADLARRSAAIGVQLVRKGELSRLRRAVLDA